MSLADIVPAGVVTGDDLVKLMEHARANNYAIPAVNCTRCVRCVLRTKDNFVALVFARQVNSIDTVNPYLTRR